MTESEIVQELSRLVSLEVDAIHAYDAAVAAVGGSATRIGGELALHKVEHQRHALELYEALLALGTNPPDVEPDVKGVVIGALTPPRANLSTEEILEAVRGNEKLTNAVYRKALGKALPPDVRAVVASAAAEEQHHLEWTERAIARRLWEADAFAAAHP
jgi:rubrerythrin